jgi:predicted S18 family serine protease
MYTQEPDEIRRSNEKTAIEEKVKKITIEVKGTERRKINKIETMWNTFETIGLSMRRLYELKRLLQNQEGNEYRIKKINRAISAHTVRTLATAQSNILSKYM